MKIGIVGTNDRAVAIGRLLAAGGHDVTLSDPTDRAKADQAASRAGVSAEIPYRQAMTRDVVVFATPGERIDPALTAMGSTPSGVIVDATDSPAAGGPSGAEMLARKLDTHNVVKALVVLPQTGANVPICGDDENAKSAVDRMFRESGCVTTDRGPLNAARELEPSAVAA